MRRTSADLGLLAAIDDGNARGTVAVDTGFDQQWYFHNDIGLTRGQCGAAAALAFDADHRVKYSFEVFFGIFITEDQITHSDTIE